MIPRSKGAIKDYVIASAFILVGILLPSSVLDVGFEQHLSGLAIGIGIGYLVKSIIVQSKG